ncbi:hypothetical protein BGW37DRAFT_541035 [Umbelopsis sp. PMI_123]|nr:hypothetical protein BGW37DRAFT_541035 [Umbelopsis sp. PMI_123]
MNHPPPLTENSASSAHHHHSVATHTKPIRSLPTLYDRHCKTDDDCPGVHCCNLWTSRCVLDPLGTICDIKPTTTNKKKTTTHKKSTTKHKTSAKSHTTTKKQLNPHTTTKSQPVGVLSETNPSSTPEPNTSAGNEGTTTSGAQPIVNDPNAPGSNTIVVTPTVATTLPASSGTLTASGAASSSTNGNNGGSNGNSNNLADSAVVSGDITNTKIGIGVGVGVGCVAAIGLVGMAAYRRHEKRQQNANFEGSSGGHVSTHWRPQSFMAVLGGVVAKLPRSSSTSSRGSSRIRSVFSNLSRNGSNRSNLSDQSVGTAPSLARVDEHYSDGQQMRQY